MTPDELTKILVINRMSRRELAQLLGVPYPRVVRWSMGGSPESLNEAAGMIRAKVAEARARR